MNYRNISSAIGFIENRMANEGEEIHTQRWQAFDISKKPEASMVELLFVSFSAPMVSELIPYQQAQCKPNLPWAEEHFKERVCGLPLNPGTEWANWPWAKHADSSREAEMFNHNYMERYWPKHAGYIKEPTASVDEFLSKSKETTPLSGILDDKPLSGVNKGIRNEYGDLSDVITLLEREPDTRQAYLPIWFPEDTGYKNKGRKPCTLGYHFIVRNNQLHIRYDIRSCDLFRHFRDDIYMTVRLAIWVLEKLRARDPDTWNDIKLGTLTMHITSLHMFINDFRVKFGKNPS